MSEEDDANKLRIISGNGISSDEDESDRKSTSSTEEPGPIEEPEGAETGDGPEEPIEIDTLAIENDALEPCESGASSVEAPPEKEQEEELCLPRLALEETKVFKEIGALLARDNPEPKPKRKSDP